MPYGRYKTDYGGVVDFHRLTRERRARAKKSMEKYNLDALICFVSANARYLTIGRAGQSGMMGGYKYVFFPVTGEPIYHDAGMMAKGVKAGVPDLDVRYSIALPPEMALSNLPAYKLQVSKFVKQIKEELDEAGVLKGKIGIDAAGPLVVDALKAEGLNMSLDGLAVMAEARVIKTKDEIELLRGACAICEGGFEVAKRMIRPGMTEQKVWGEICKVAFELGAEGVEGGHISSGPHSYPIANAISDRIIRPGDIILIDIYNVSYHGYRTCYYRDFSCGEPTQKQKDAWYKARDLTLETISKMKPGVSTKEMCEGWPKAQDYGYDSEDDATMSQWSHGIGLDQYERPTVGRAWSLDYPEELQEGMVIAVETQWPTGEITGQYPHGQCLRIEDEVAITKNGCEVLTQWPIDEITVCW